MNYLGQRLHNFVLKKSAKIVFSCDFRDTSYVRRISLLKYFSLNELTGNGGCELVSCFQMAHSSGQKMHVRG